MKIREVFYWIQIIAIIYAVAQSIYFLILYFLSNDVGFIFYFVTFGAVAIVWYGYLQKQRDKVNEKTTVK